MNIKMKIQLFWFLTTTSLVFAGFNRRATLRDGIERRGDVYNQCVLSIIKEGTEKAEQAVPAVEECIKRLEKSIEESCLAPYTDQDQDARTKNMNSCFNVQVTLVRPQLSALSH